MSLGLASLPLFRVSVELPGPARKVPSHGVVAFRCRLGKGSAGTPFPGKAFGGREGAERSALSPLWPPGVCPREDCVALPGAAPGGSSALLVPVTTGGG